MIAIYKASAGSGKTFTLAYEYIKMLLGRKLPGATAYRLDSRSRRRHRSLLAITFTNKATEEMKRRIIHELAVIAGAEPGWTAPSPYIDSLCRDLGSSPELIAAEARRALADLLFDYGSFAVSTIDSFFQQVLRTFAREADLTGNYEVNLDDDALIDMALVNLFRSLEFNKDAATRRTAGWLTAYLRQRMTSGKSVELFNRKSELFASLHKFVRKALDETFALHAAEITAFMSDPAAIGRLIKALNDRLAAVTATVTAQCSTAIRLLADRKGLNANVLKPISRFAAGDRGVAASATVRKAADDPSTAFTKTKDGRLLLADTSVAEAVGEAAAAITAYTSTSRDITLIRENLHFLGLLSDVMREMETLRRDNNMLLLSDTNSILREIIADDETPFLYERMGVWIENFLIDEFQDTSLMQWHNLRPLIAEGLATDRDSLIIGDEKQCIYRFRSSDPTLLQHQVSDQFGNAATVCGDTPEGNTNWRSSATVVDFNNRFFSTAASINGIADIYANVIQAVPDRHRDHTGYVSVVRTQGSADESAREGYRRMADEIARQIASGYDPADIAVLTRFTRHASEAIAYLLRRQETDPSYPRFRIISDDSIMVGQSKAVKLIVSVLRSLLLSRPGDMAAADTGDRRRRNHTLEEIVLARLINDYEYATARGTAPDEALRIAIASSRDADPAAAPCRAMIDSAMVCPNLQTLVDRVISSFVDGATLDDENIYITAFQDLTATFVMRGGSDLRAFLDWWDSKGWRTPVASPGVAGSLRVMTIHKSKGLEFKCVHIPVASWPMTDFRDVEWFAVTGDIGGIDRSLLPPFLPLLPRKDMTDTSFREQYERRVRESVLDETNTLYVAFTRAVDELIVTYDSGRAATTGSMIATVAETLGEGDGTLTAGAPQTKRAEGPRALTAMEPAGLTEIEPRFPADRASLWADTRLDLPFDPLTPRGRGIMLHDILAHVGVRADLGRAVRLMVSRGVVPASMAPELREILERELDRPEVGRWFDGFRRYMTERPIAIGPGGSDHRRPDRVVWTADGHVDVIDYKSGDERRGAHIRQVLFYMGQLRRLGYRKVRGYIWYLDSGEIIPAAPG